MRVEFGVYAKKYLLTTKSKVSSRSFIGKEPPANKITPLSTLHTQSGVESGELGVEQSRIPIFLPKHKFILKWNLRVKRKIKKLHSQHSTLNQAEGDFFGRRDKGS